ncbi:MAG TPA: TetR/AcrR family transcriptional regulator [Caulobacteraceae bacterium]
MTTNRTTTGPRRRRKEARPSEIVAAAMDVFAERGYGAAKLEEVARRAGVAKGTVFVYFPTKEDLFRAVAQAILAAHLERLDNAASDPELPLTTLIPLLLDQAALTGQSRAAVVIRLLIAEARVFPDLAQVWHDEVLGKVLGVVTAAIERAQARGEIRSGDAKLYAFSIMGPILAGVVFREVFSQTDVALPDLSVLAKQHAQAILHGLVIV